MSEHRGFMGRFAELAKEAERKMNVQHRVEDVWWFDAPLPGRFHRCSRWTSAWHGLTFVERCACGAIRRDNCGAWLGRNERRRGARRGR